MFWIHGGGEGGTASDELYNYGTLVNYRVLLVTANYRLGVFGFFAHPGLTRETEHHNSGNYGLMDQIAAPANGSVPTSPNSASIRQTLPFLVNLPVLSTPAF